MLSGVEAVVAGTRNIWPGAFSLNYFAIDGVSLTIDNRTPKIWGETNDVENPLNSKILAHCSELAHAAYNKYGFCTKCSAIYGD